MTRNSPSPTLTPRRPRRRLLAAVAAALLLLAVPAPVSPATAVTVPQFTDAKAMYAAGSAKVNVNADSSSVDYTLKSLEGATVRSGKATVSAGKAVIDVSAQGPGYFILTVSNTAGSATTSLGVVEGLANTPTASSFFGASEHPGIHPGLDSSAALRDMGVGTVRVDWRWELMATATPGVYNWDAVVEGEISRLLARGIRPYLALAYHGLCDSQRTPSSDGCIKEYVDFVAATARKFAGSVDYAIYNEWNVGTNNGACGLGPDCYMALLQPASAAIKANAPGSIIYGPALGAVDDWWAAGGEAYTWFDRFVQLGGHRHVDGITIHNYSLNGLPEGHGERAISNARSLLASVGSQQPVIMEEAGYYTGSSPVAPSEAKQADYFVRDAVPCLAAGAARYMHYGFMDNWNDPANPEGNFGQMRHEYGTGGRITPKPSAVAQSVLSIRTAGNRVIGNESLGNGVRSVAFLRPDGRVLRVVWSADSVARKLTLANPGTLSVTDIYGRSVAPAATTNGASMTINGSPLLITSANTAVAAAG